MEGLRHVTRFPLGLREGGDLLVNVEEGLNSG